MMNHQPTAAAASSGETQLQPTSMGFTPGWVSSLWGSWVGRHLMQCVWLGSPPATQDGLLAASVRVCTRQSEPLSGGKFLWDLAELAFFPTLYSCVHPLWPHWWLPANTQGRTAPCFTNYFRHRRRLNHPKSDKYAWICKSPEISLTNLHYNPMLKDQLQRCCRMMRGRFMPKKQKSRPFIKLKWWEKGSHGHAGWYRKSIRKKSASIYD